MQVVKITISNPNLEVEENATIIQETKRGDNWNRDDSVDVAVGKSETTKSFQLRRDQRLVIEARTEQELRLDPVQFAAVDTRVQENDAGRADTPKERAEGANLKQAEQRAERDAKLNRAPGMSVPEMPGVARVSPVQPVRTGEVKKDDTNKTVGARDSTAVRDSRPV